MGILVYSIRQTCTLLTLSVILGAALQSVAEEPQTRKTWRFHGQEGEVEIELTRFVNRDGTTPTSLHIYSPNGMPRSVTEEAGFLATVLNELPSTGISVQSLDWISFRSNEPEAVSKVATCAAASKLWRESLTTKNASVLYPLVTSCLITSGAYDEWDRVFRGYGLTLKAVGVENVIMESFSRLHATCPAGARCKTLRVPADALAQMNVVRIAH